MNCHKRAELLHEASRAMRQARATVAEMLTREMGKPYKESADEVIWDLRPCAESRWRTTSYCVTAE